MIVNTYGGSVEMRLNSMLWTLAVRSPPAPGALAVAYSHAVAKVPAQDCIHVVIEIPRGSRNKYEIDHDESCLSRSPAVHGDDVSGGLRLLAGDPRWGRDPLDALVLLDDPVYPGVWVEAGRSVCCTWRTRPARTPS